MDVQKWTQRTFEFGIPVSYMPYIVERLAGTPARIQEKIECYAPEILDKRLGNNWSILEHIGHLTDLEALQIGRLEDIKSGVTLLRPADMTNQKTELANHNNKSVGELLQALRTVRIAFTNQLSELDEVGLQKGGFHERLGSTMRVIDIAYFTAEHDDHHLAKMTEMTHRLSKA